MIQRKCQVLAKFGNLPLRGTVWLSLLSLFALFPADLIAQGTSQAGTSSVVSKYIGAIQKRDFKTIIDLTYYYQQEVARIKAANPQVLWPKLIGDYYQGKISELSRQPAGFWEQFAEGAQADVGNPIQALRATTALLPPSTKWAITESRKAVSQNVFTGTAEVTVTYIQVEYATSESSPIVEVPGSFQTKKRLHKAIIQFDTDSKTDLVRSVGRLAAGDEYWPIPPLTNQIAHDTVMTQLGDTALHFHVSFFIDSPAVGDQQPWVEIGVPWIGPTWNTVTTWHVNYRQFLHQNGFEVGAFDESPSGNGKGSKAQPPASWGKYGLMGQNRQAPDFRASYRVDEKTDVQIVSIDFNEQAGTATAKITLTHDGCNDDASLFWRSTKLRNLTPSAETISECGATMPGVCLTSEIR